MATMYCALCSRPVEARRRIGAGTLVLGLFTAGISLLAIPFYPRRCSICGSSDVTRPLPAGALGTGGQPYDRLAELEQRLALVERSSNTRPGISGA